VQVQAVENQPDFIQLQENTVVQKGETFVKKEFPGQGCFFGGGNRHLCWKRWEITV